MHLLHGFGDKPRVTVAFDIFPESIYFGETETQYDWSLDGRMYQAIPFPDLWVEDR